MVLCTESLLDCSGLLSIALVINSRRMKADTEVGLGSLFSNLFFFLPVGKQQWTLTVLTSLKASYTGYRRIREKYGHKINLGKTRKRK